MEENNKIIPVVGYIRESTERQGISGYRSEVQRDNIERYCQRQNFKLVKMFSDWGSGGDVKNRPHFLEMLEYVKEEKISFIVIDETSRFFRNLKDTLNFEEDLQENHGIFAIDTRIDYSPRSYLENNRIPTSIWTQRINARQRAEEERRWTQERVEEGYQKKAARGQYVGPLCFAVEWVDENHKYIRFDVEKSNIVTTIFNLYLTEQYGFTSLARYLNEKGYKQEKTIRKVVIKSGAKYFDCKKILTPFTKDAVRSILTNKTYIGYQNTGNHLRLTTLDKNGNETTFAPLINEEVFNKVQERMHQNRRGKPNIKGKRNSKQKRTYLFQGIIKNAVNGSPMYGHGESNNGKDTRRYVCKNNILGVGDKIPSVHADEVEMQIIDLLKEIKIKNIQQIEDQLKGIIKINAKALKKNRNKKSNNKAQMDLKRLEKVREGNANWQIEEMCKQLKDKIEEAEEKKSKRKSEEVKYYCFIELRNVFVHIATEFQQLQNLAQRKNLIQILFKEIFVAKMDTKGLVEDLLTEADLNSKGYKDYGSIKTKKDALKLHNLLKRFVPWFFEEIYTSKEKNVNKVIFKPTGLFLMMVDDDRPITSEKEGLGGVEGNGKLIYRNFYRKSMESFPAHQNAIKWHFLVF